MMRKMGSVPLGRTRIQELPKSILKPSRVLVLPEPKAAGPSVCGGAGGFAAPSPFRGSVSGGCLEDDLLRRIRAGEWDAGLPRCLSYGGEGGLTPPFELPCGGRLELLVERLAAAPPLRRLAAALAAPAAVPADTPTI